MRSETETSGSMHDARWQQLVANMPVVSRRMVKGASRVISVQHPSRVTTRWPLHQTIAVGSFLAAALAIFLSPRLRSFGDWTLRCGAAFGLALLLSAVILTRTSLLLAIVSVFLVIFAVWLRRSAVADPMLSAIVLRSGKDT